MKNRRTRFILALCALIAAAGIGRLAVAGEEIPQIGYAAFWEMAEQGEVESVILSDGENWQVTLRDGSRALTPNPRAEDGKERLLRLGVQATERQSAASLPMLLLLLAAGGLLIWQGRGRGSVAGLQKYAAVEANQTIPEVTFADVAVSPETLRSMEDLVGFLKTPGRYESLGARRPRGVMLYGPPGTGKTMLARALAGEAKAPFFAISGADFVQVYVGVGASRVRELFKKARKAGGGVIFIDEIDAIGKKRDSGNDEREQTLNALLTEMSGFSGADNIIVLAATNRLDTLDPALLREGRFDRRIEVGLPDADQRLRILRVHARRKPLSPLISLEDLARQTALFSGAQLETLLNEAAIRAARRGAEEITPEDAEAAFCAVTVGDERPGVLTEKEKKITAWHEAGHALVTHHLLPDHRVTRLTVIPSSRGAAGYTMSIQPDQHLHSRSQLICMIAQALAGRAAEEMLLGRDDVTTGAAGDWKRAREIAAAMTDDFVMGQGGGRERDQKMILEAGLSAARDCLSAHRDQLERLARVLIEKETLREEEILKIME